MSQPEIITVNSEAMEAEVRSLLPSQNGFGSELQASNVITPIIDLTPVASGSNLPTYIQTAINFAGATVFGVGGSTQTIASSAGFYRVQGVSSIICSTADQHFNAVQISDGAETRNVWIHQVPNTANQGAMSVDVDLTFFLRAGDSLIAHSETTNAKFGGSVRQVATVTGELVNPSGFVLE